MSKQRYTCVNSPASLPVDSVPSFPSETLFKAVTLTDETKSQLSELHAKKLKWILKLWQSRERVKEAEALVSQEIEILKQVDQQIAKLMLPHDLRDMLFDNEAFYMLDLNSKE